jgi:phosphoribosylformimino-5-aminoimidazole carboxamide ribotide isomerase
MLLVIPSITIKHDRCQGRIIYSSNGNSALSYENPQDRVRLLRKENAKAIHLIFEDEKEWNRETLETIRKVREVIDIPIEISLSSVPNDRKDIKQILESGIYRLFLPDSADDLFVGDCISDFSKQKIAVSLPVDNAEKEVFQRLKADGIIRACITLSEGNPLFPIEQLRTIASNAKDIGMRLSLQFGVHSYKELMQLSSLEPGFDSVILGSALEENSFPCEGIWREVESRAAALGKGEANLWKNPLADIQHL